MAKFGLKKLVTLFYRMVQSTYCYVEPFRHGSWVWQTETDRQTFS